jgi:hypothetical protein
MMELALLAPVFAAEPGFGSGLRLFAGGSTMFATHPRSVDLAVSRAEVRDLKAQMRSSRLHGIVLG